MNKQDRVKINNFICCKTIEEANKIDFEQYTFLCKDDDGWHFKIRQR